MCVEHVYTCIHVMKCMIHYSMFHISCQVVGYKLTGVVDSYSTSTDVVLTITKVYI